ncbi:oxidoreductase [Nibricoccus aquaticus]|uniref:Oxidoreductase n=1 Tax=Nibricoccus aquaticus TaxID=2576891 RepID=A0A290Q8Q7_9BACT|nr:Gfo/Idh/MocA family oxidoreductase [Nibricoccus aquaticus]ATC64627.1 oxidoreductase [Nibricoccus aquaticus]
MNQAPVPLRLGIVGLDSSHAVSLARLCNGTSSLLNARVVAAWAGGSLDLPLSATRIDGFTQEVREIFGVEILDTPEAVAERSDAVAILSMDGRAHPSQFARIASLQRPIFINKPLAITRREAAAVEDLAQKHNVRWFSASALRFAAHYEPKVQNAEVECPLWFEPGNAGWFWYGIHGVELLLKVMGPGVRSVRVKVLPDREILHLDWKNGRRGRVTGLLTREAPYSLSLDGVPQPCIDLAQAVSSLEKSMLTFFQGAPPPVNPEDTLEVIQCIEAANHSRVCGGSKISL